MQPIVDNRPRLDLLEEAKQYLASHPPITRLAINDVTRQRGIEFATAVLFQHFQTQLTGELSSLSVFAPSRFSETETALPSNLEINATLAIVPGALYQERPDVGGDGKMLRQVAKKYKWNVELIPTNGVGRVSENATKIRKWLAERRDRPVILVSISKGTTDTVAALCGGGQTLPPNIVGWVSVSGIPFGTPMVNWMMKRWMFRRIYRFACWIRKASPAAVEDLAFSANNFDGFNQHTDMSIPIYHLAAFPCREHLSCRRARLWYRRFKHEGPTDSVLMLRDLLEVPGIVIPIWGADHYLKTAWDADATFARIFAHLAAQCPELRGDGVRTTKMNDNDRSRHASLTHQPTMSERP